MGAAGYVTVYDEAAVRAKYAELYPGQDIDQDWWYLKTITAELAGKKWIFDYADDQGGHTGSEENFWFGHYEPGGYVIEPQVAQDRVLAVLHEVGPIANTEVWT